MTEGADYSRHRDLIGYGEHRPNAEWPGGARVAVQFVLNYEEGGEMCVLHGDGQAETFLSDILPAPYLPGERHMSVESLFEYGSRAGVWRILRLFEERSWPLTIFAVGGALERYPAMAKRFHDRGHEIAGHGYRWINYQTMSEADEAAEIQATTDVIRDLTGAACQGWYTGRTSPQTLKIIAEKGEFAYCADDYSDDLPFWDCRWGKPLLIVPYALDTNDMRFATAHGFANGEQFFNYLKDAFDTLYSEGAERAAMMSVGLHCRLVGKPARFAGLQRFVDYLQGFPDIWVTRRIDIAEHWRARFPAPESAA